MYLYIYTLDIYVACYLQTLVCYSREIYCIGYRIEAVNLFFISFFGLSETRAVSELGLLDEKMNYAALIYSCDWGVYRKFLLCSRNRLNMPFYISIWLILVWFLRKKYSEWWMCRGWVCYI